VLVGLIVGYLSYEVIHFAIHCFPSVRRFVRPLASHHLHHHYADPSRCYGVTSPLWDWIFRTGRRPRMERDLTGRRLLPNVKPNYPSVP
jgi:sterol desaturase/sphingolipid hydroxylase (fatty acid hydroxylase superfamily)